MPRRPRTPQDGDPQVVDVLADNSADRAGPVDPEVPDYLPAAQVPAPVEPQQPADHRPVPEAELTPDQRRIRDLEDRLAKELGRKDPDLQLAAPAEPGAAGNIIIHFLEDGFTAL